MFTKGKAVKRATPSKPTATVEPKKVLGLSVSNDSKGPVQKSLLVRDVGSTNSRGTDVVSSRQIGNTYDRRDGLLGVVDLVDNDVEFVSPRSQTASTSLRRISDVPVETEKREEMSKPVLESLVSNTAVQLGNLCVPVTCDRDTRLMVSVSMPTILEDPQAIVQALGGVDNVRGLQFHPSQLSFATRVFRRIKLAKANDTEGVLTPLFEDDEKLGTLLRTAERDLQVAEDLKAANFSSTMKLTLPGDIIAEGEFQTGPSQRLVVRVQRRKRAGPVVSSPTSNDSAKSLLTHVGVGFPDCLGRKGESQQGMARALLNSFEGAQEPLVSYERLTRQRKRGSSASVSRAELTALSHSLSVTPRQASPTPWVTAKPGLVNISKLPVALPLSCAASPSYAATLQGVVKNNVFFTDSTYLHTAMEDSGRSNGTASQAGLLVAEMEALQIERTGMDGVDLEHVELQGNSNVSVLEAPLVGGVTDTSLFPVYDKDIMERLQDVNLKLGKQSTGIVSRVNVYEETQRKIKEEIQQRSHDAAKWLFADDESQPDDSSEDTMMSDTDNMVSSAALTHNYQELSEGSYRLQNTRISLAMRNMVVPTDARMAAMLSNSEKEGQPVTMRGLLGLLRVSDLYEDPADAPLPVLRSMIVDDRNIRPLPLNALQINRTADLLAVLNKLGRDPVYGEELGVDHVEHVEQLLPAEPICAPAQPFDVDFSTEPYSLRTAIGDAAEETVTGEDMCASEDEVIKGMATMLHRLENVVMHAVRVALRAQGVISTKEQALLLLKTVRVIVNTFVHAVQDQSIFNTGISLFGITFRATYAKPLSIQFIALLCLHVSIPQLEPLQFQVHQWDDLKWLFLDYTEFRTQYKYQNGIAPNAQSPTFSVFIYFSVYKGLFTCQYVPLVPSRLDTCMRFFYKWGLAVLIALQVFMHPATCRALYNAPLELKLCDDKVSNAQTGDIRRLTGFIGMPQVKVGSIGLHMLSLSEESWIDRIRPPTNTNTTVEPSAVPIVPEVIQFMSMTEIDQEEQVKGERNNDNDDDVVVVSVFNSTSANEVMSDSINEESSTDAPTDSRENDDGGDLLHGFSETHSLVIPHLNFTSLPATHKQLVDLLPSANTIYSVFGMLFVLTASTQFPSLPLDPAFLQQSEGFATCNGFISQMGPTGKVEVGVHPGFPLWAFNRLAFRSRFASQRINLSVSDALSNIEHPKHRMLQVLSRILCNWPLPGPDEEETDVSKIGSELAAKLYSSGLPCAVYMGTDQVEFVKQHLEDEQCSVCSTAAQHAQMKQFLRQLLEDYEPTVFPHVSVRLLAVLLSLVYTRQAETFTKDKPLQSLDLLFHHRNVCSGPFQTWLLVPPIVERDKQPLELPLSSYTMSRFRSLCRIVFATTLNQVLGQISNPALMQDGVLWSSLEQADQFEISAVKQEALANQHGFAFSTIEASKKVCFMQTLDACARNTKQYLKEETGTMGMREGEVIAIYPEPMDNVEFMDQQIVQEMYDWRSRRVYSAFFQYQKIYHLYAGRHLDIQFQALAALDDVELDGAPPNATDSIPNMWRPLGMGEIEGENLRKYQLRPGKTSFKVSRKKSTYVPREKKGPRKKYSLVDGLEAKKDKTRVKRQGTHTQERVPDQKHEDATLEIQESDFSESVSGSDISSDEYYNQPDTEEEEDALQESSSEEEVATPITYAQASGTTDEEDGSRGFFIPIMQGIPRPPTGPTRKRKQQ